MNDSWPLVVLYILVIALLGLVSIDLFGSKADCEDAILEWSRAELIQPNSAVAAASKERAEKACRTLELKAQVVDKALSNQ